MNKRSMEVTSAIVILLLGFIVVLLIVYYGVLSAEDTEGFRAINSLASSSTVTDVAIVVTYFGSELILVPLALLTYFLGKANRLETVILAGVTIAASDLLLLILKTAYVRPRPSHVLSNVILPLGVDNESSFPSGHTTRAFAFASLVWLRLGRRYVFLVVLAIGVGISRVILGVHYPLDVVGGALLGSAIGLIILEYGRRPYRYVMTRLFPGRTLP